MKLFLFIMMFFLIGAFFIISENNLSIIEGHDQDVLIKMYSAWIGKILDNSRSLSGYVIRMNWLPEK